MSKKILFACFFTILLNACVTNRAGRSQLAYMSNDEMSVMGIQAFEQMKQKQTISHNQPYIAFVQCISNAITQPLAGDWEVVVFEDKTLNAFALPGNKIGVHTGLIKLVENQDQLATVIGHEVAHVLNNHSNERMSQQAAMQQGMAVAQALGKASGSVYGDLAVGALGIGAQYGVLLPYSRLHESEADVYGLELMAKAGFDPKQSVVLWERMSRASGNRNVSEFMSTHPSHDTRISELQSHVPKALQLQQQARQQGKQPNCRK